MKIELFEPPMCCSSGVCGPSVDPKLVKLQETLRRIEEEGGGAIEVSRHNLSTDLEAFAKNKAASEILKEQGPHVLPVVFIDGELIAERKYPTTEEWQVTLKERGVEIDLGAAPSPKSSGCGPGCKC